MGLLRYPRTTAESRMNQNSRLCRAKRRPSHLPNSFDDLFPSTYGHRSWKRHRNTQFRVVCMFQEVDPGGGEMTQTKLTPEQVQHEHSLIMGEYLDAKEVIKAKRGKKLDALRERCPHEDIDKDGPGPPWCCHCESEVRERIGVALEDSDPKPEGRCGAGGMKAFGRIAIPEGTELYWDDENHTVTVRLGENFMSVVDILRSGQTLYELRDEVES